MKTILAGFAGIVVLAVIANYALNSAGFSSQDKFSSDSVRLEDSY
ncbi:hypothetical protein [Actibacterium atlanticum]|nr:hypothetical protein [Actibacterium atlanticum]